MYRRLKMKRRCIIALLGHLVSHHRPHQESMLRRRVQLKSVPTSRQCGQSNPSYIEINSNGLDESVSSLELSTSDRDAIAYLGGLRRRHNAILLEGTADKVNEQPNAARSATRRRRATVSGSIPSLLTANKMNVDHDLIAETQAYQRMKHISDQHQVQLTI